MGSNQQEPQDIEVKRASKGWGRQHECPTVITVYVKKITHKSTIYSCVCLCMCVLVPSGLIGEGWGCLEGVGDTRFFVSQHLFYFKATGNHFYTF